MTIGRSYFFAGEDPAELSYQRKLAEALMARGSQPREIKHWTQGAAQIADAIVGGLMARRASATERSERERASAAAMPHIEALFRSSSTQPAAQTSAAAKPQEVEPSPTFDARRPPEAQPSLAGTFDTRRPPAMQPMMPGEAYPPAAEREQFWRILAERKGLNPDALVTGLKAENLNDSGDLRSSAVNDSGIREPSYGDAQLLIGGPGTGYPAGLGNEALAAGIDPRDPGQWQRAADFATDKMAAGGPGPWYGFKRAGVTDQALRGLPKPAQQVAGLPMRLGPPEDAPAEELPWLKPGGQAPDADVSGIVSALQNPYLPEGTRALLLKALEQRLPKTGIEKFGKGESAYDYETGRWITPPTASAEAPVIRDGYDSEGRKIKQQWNPQTRQWDQVGGAYKKAVYRTPTTEKAILETDDKIRAGEASIKSLRQALDLSPKVGAAGLLGKTGTRLGSWWEGEGGGASTNAVKLDNIVMTQVLENLKATFGGNPTEGERAILEEIAGSSSLPHEVRKDIFDRAIAMAEAKIAFNREKAKGLRDGTYYAPEGDPNAEDDEGPSLEELEAELERRRGG